MLMRLFCVTIPICVRLNRLFELFAWTFRSLVKSFRSWNGTKSIKFSTFEDPIKCTDTALSLRSVPADTLLCRNPLRFNNVIQFFELRFLTFLFTHIVTFPMLHFLTFQFTHIVTFPMLHFLTFQFTCYIYSHSSATFPYIPIYTCYYIYVSLHSYLHMLLHLRFLTFLFTQVILFYLLRFLSHLGNNHLIAMLTNNRICFVLISVCSLQSYNWTDQQ